MAVWTPDSSNVSIGNKREGAPAFFHVTASRSSVLSLMVDQKVSPGEWKP